MKGAVSDWCVGGWEGKPTGLGTEEMIIMMLAEMVTIMMMKTNRRCLLLGDREDPQTDFILLPMLSPSGSPAGNPRSAQADRALLG